jgi:hypothetical protein
MERQGNRCGTLTRGGRAAKASAWLAACAGLAGSAWAQPAGPGGFSVWNQPVSESWFTFARWDAGVPQPTQTAIIGQAGTYEVSILNNVATCHHLGIGLPTISVRVAHSSLGGQAWLTVNGTQVENAGTITLGGAGHAGQANFQLGTNLTVNGTGRISMDPQAGAASINGLFGTPWFLVQNAGHTIEGAGSISVPMQNDGLIEANIPGRQLSLTSGSKTNNGEIVARNGATVRIDANIGSAPHFVQSASGVVRAENGSAVVLVSASTGGTLQTQGTGEILIVSQGTDLDSMTIAPGSVMRMISNAGVFAGPGGLVNHGTIDLGPQGFFASRFAASTTLSGTGRLRMGDGGTLSNVFGNGGGYALTNGADHTISGTGRVALTLTNLGTVSADRNGLTTGPTNMVFQQGNKNNQGLMQAINTGIIELQQDTTITQTGSGRVFAGDGSSVLLNGFSAGIIGGRIGTAGTGEVVANANPVLLEGVTIDPGARVRVACSRVLQLRGTIQNEGVITVDQGGCGSNFAALRGSGAVVSGNGEIRLVTTGFGLNARLIGDGPAFGIGAGQRVTGSGSLVSQIDLGGVVSPDNATGVTQIIGEITLSGVTLQMQPSGGLEIDITGSNVFDRVTGSGSVGLDGTLAVRFPGSFRPSPGQTFDVLTATGVSGGFDTLTVSPPSAGGVRVVVLPDRLRLVACPGDLTGDGQVDSGDLAAFILAFIAGDANVADLSGDGQVDSGDLQAYVNAFLAGC